MSRRFQTFR